MNEALVQEIRQLGHWRVNFQPLSVPKSELRLAELQEVVEKSRVSIRGWDFPHVSVGRDNHGRYDNYGKYVENWTDWYGFLEFWQIYRSTQFLFMSALREDTKREEFKLTDQARGLGVVSTIYSVAEFFEFANRATKNGLYADGLRAIIQLGNMADRFLFVDASNRMPFFDAKTTKAEKIRFERELSRTAVMENHREIALDCILYIFDHFGWAPPRAQIENDIERFYSRQFSV